MARAEMTVAMRARGMRPARLVAAVANVLGSRRLLAWAVTLIRVDWRIGDRGKWTPLLRARAEDDQIVLYEVAER